MVLNVLELIKARLGISTNVRDTYLVAIINGIIQELSRIQGLIIDEKDSSHLMFIVDYAEYRYSNRDTKEMPRHLNFRLHNMLISNKALNVNEIVSVSTLPNVPKSNTVYILPDGTKQMILNNTWTSVNMLSGVWMVI